MKINMRQDKSVWGRFCWAILLLALAGASHAQEYMLDNGVIRFGGDGGANGQTTEVTTNSISASGMPEQPFYRAADDRWFKLTFSNAPLSMTLGTGTDGSNWTGSTVPESVPGFDNGRLGLTNLDMLDVTVSNWQERRLEGGVSAGYGTLTVTGVVDVNSQDVGVRHTIELGENEAFVRVTTQITNNDTSPIPNANVWVGTRDDYVGTDDRPNKIRGNIGDGEFVEISAPSDPSAALLVRSGDEAVLFYSTTMGVNAVWAGCCNFRNAYNTNPATNPTQSGDNHDGSYAIHLPVGDLAPGASRELTWFYAAGALADIENIVREVAQAAGSITNIGPTSADLEVTSSEDGMGYWMVVPQGSAVPTPAQIEAGVNYGDVDAVASGNLALVQNEPTTIQLTPLSQETAYTVYFVVVTLDGDQQVYSDIVHESFTTTLPPPVPDPDSAQSSVVASASNPAAGEPVTITVTALESNGNPVVGLEVVLTATPEADVTIEASNPATTQDDGRATFVVRSAVPQSVRFTASYNPDIGFVDVVWSEAVPSQPPLEPNAIPTVGLYGLLAMSGLLGLIGALRIRRRRRAS